MEINNLAINVSNLVIKYKHINNFSIKKNLLSINKKHKKDFYAINDVSFCVEKGKVIGIIGKNGSGKSTLLKAITGIISPDTGCVNLYNNSVSLMSIGVGFQKEISGRDNIILSGMLLGFSKKEIIDKIDYIIDFSELGGFIDMPVRTYSSGMYSKLAFSITACLEPDIMLIDEVFSVGDKDFKKKSSDKIYSLIRDSNRTVIMVSHNLESIEKICDYVIWLEKGKIKKIGDTREILPEYKN